MPICTDDVFAVSASVMDAKTAAMFNKSPTKKQGRYLSAPRTGGLSIFHQCGLDR